MNLDVFDGALALKGGEALDMVNGSHPVTGRLELPRTRRTEDGAAHPAHLQLGVGGVDDGVHGHFRNVLADNGKRHEITFPFSASSLF